MQKGNYQIETEGMNHPIDGNRNWATDVNATTAPSNRRLVLVLLGNAFLRIANSAGGGLVGFYLADLTNKGRAIDAALVGTLGAMTFIAGWLGKWFYVDGLIYGTVAMAAIAFVTVWFLPDD